MTTTVDDDDDDDDADDGNDVNKLPGSVIKFPPRAQCVSRSQLPPPPPEERHQGREQCRRENVPVRQTRLNAGLQRGMMFMCMIYGMLFMWIINEQHPTWMLRR